MLTDFKLMPKQRCLVDFVTVLFEAMFSTVLLYTISLHIVPIREHKDMKEGL